MDALFERLKVWQLSHRLALRIYKVTAKFPPSERYGLAMQLRRAAAAIPTNIVEGNARHHRREYVQFCTIARGSVAEVKYLLRLTLDLEYLVKGEYDSLFSGYDETGKMLQGLINELNRSV